MKKTLFFFMVTLGTAIDVNAVTRYWVGGSSGNFTDYTQWSLSSGGTPISSSFSWSSSDVAVFDSNSGSTTVTQTSSEYIDKLQISGSITVVFKPDAGGSRILTVGHVGASNNFSLAAASTLIISGLDAATDRNMSLKINGIAGVNAVVAGYVKVMDESTGYGEFRRETSDATITFQAGSTYEHASAESGSDIPIATWSPTATCLITGITGSMPGNLDQSFGNFTWNCPSQNSAFNFPLLGTIQGNFTINSTGSSLITLSTTSDVTLYISGNYSQTGGYFYPSNGYADDFIYLSGNFSLSGGYLGSQPEGSTTLIFNKSGTQTYTKTGGTLSNNIHFQINSGSTLDISQGVVGDASYCSGSFTLSSGAGLRTIHTQGITTAYNQGCVQLSGAKSYSAGASYGFYASGSQATGNAFPSPLSGTLTIGSTSNATNLSFTNGSPTINGTLVLVSSGSSNSTIVSGTPTYGSSSILEYQGASSQTPTSTEWPASSSPPNVKINNGNGVQLPSSFARTVSGTLFLTQGNLSIGNNTLTINGLINKTSGGLTGGSGSDLVIGPNASSTNLPAVSLNNLTLNRSAGVGLSGNVSVGGTMTMSAGTLTLNGYSLSYGPAGVLLYNGASAQTTASAEFPATSGPQDLRIQNTSGVNLHGDRTVPGILDLQGPFTIGSHTLSLNGSLSITGAGQLIGGTGAGLNLNEPGGSFSLPSINLENLSLNRSAGAVLGGAVTVNGNLSLASGTLTLGDQTLNLNGAISQTSGTMLGSLTGSTLVFGGSGSSTNLPGIDLLNLTLNRANGVGLSGDVQIGGALELSSGSLSISNNTLTLNGSLLQTGGGLNGGSSSNIVIGGTTGNLGLPGVSLNALTVNRADGASLTGSVTVGGTLTLQNGTLAIGSQTLTLNGNLSIGSGNLQGGTASRLLVGGSTAPALSLPGLSLGTFTLNRPNGVTLGGNLDISTQLSMASGAITPGSYSVTYQTGAGLTYQGALGQTTTDIEFPETSGPTNLTVLNNGGLNLHESRFLPGTLSLKLGTLSLGGNTLEVQGAIVKQMGGLTGGPSSNLILSGTGPHCFLPSVSLNNLSIDRVNGISLGGPVEVSGLLTLAAGPLNMYGGTLTLSGTVTTSGGTLVGDPASTVQITGSGAQVQLPELQTGALVLDRSNGLVLGGNLSVESTLALNNGILSIGNHTLTLNGTLSNGGGSLSGGSNAKLMIGGSGSSPQLPGLTLNNFVLDRTEGADIQGDMIIQGSCTLLNGVPVWNGNKLTLHNPIQGNPGLLGLGASDDLEISGSSTGMDIGPSDNVRITAVNHLTISNTSTGGTALNDALEVQGDLTVTGGARLTVNPGQALTVSGNTLLNEAAGLVIGSSATETGSFLDNGSISYGPGASARFERYTTGHFYSGPGNSFHQIALPISNTIPAGSDPGQTGSVFLNCSLDAYDEPANQWVGLTSANSVSPDRGYLTEYIYGGTAPSFKRLSLQGSFNTGSKTFSITCSGSGYNLVPNPYPSSIDWDQPDDPLYWSRTSLNPNDGYDIWIWNSTAGAWGVYNSGDGGIGTNGVTNLIQAGQSFFVQASGAGTLGMTNGVRTHSSQSFLKNNTTLANILRIKVSQGLYADEALIRFDSLAPGGGTIKWNSLIGDAPDLSSEKNGQHYSINVFQNPGPDLAIPLHFSPGISGSFTFAFSFPGAFDPGTVLFIEDLFTGQWTDLMENPLLTLAATANDNPHRFILHANPSITGTTPEMTTEALQISENGLVRVDNSHSAYCFLDQLDLSGRLIHQWSLPEGIVEIQVAKNPGLSIFRLGAGDKSIYRKAFIPFQP